MDSEIALVEIQGEGGDLVLATREVARGGPHVHTLGARGAPRFRIEEPWSDDAWQVGRLPESHGVRGTVPESVEWEYLQWAEGAAAENGASLLGALPTGRYLAVRASRRPRVSPWILLGNETVEHGPSTAVLLDVDRFYAAWFGPSEHRQPSTTWPLVGVVVLNCTWQSGLDEVLFFDCASATEVGDRGAGTALDDRNPVLVVPIRGPLVLHGCVYTDMGNRAADVQRWEERDALRFAQAIAAWGP